MKSLRVLKFLVLILLTGVGLNGCSTKAEQPNAQSSGTAASPAASPEEPLEPTKASVSGFEITEVPIVNPTLGAFPYFSLIDGYSKWNSKSIAVPTGNKDAAFDKYEFFDGTKLIPVEGRLATIDAKGEGASAVQIMRTYESLVTGLGGVKVFEGTAKNLEDRGIKFSDERHRNSTWDDDQFGVYVVRMPDREVWVEAYISTYPTQKGHYYLTVVERKALDVKASLLPAEEMKKALDAAGHVTLYINFDFNKADIKPDSQPIIDEIVKLLNTSSDLRLTIEGHTDNVGTPDYNRKLSDDRARAVVAALTARGIASSRLNSAGFGQDNPIADNNSEEGRAKNRRVELVKRS